MAAALSLDSIVIAVQRDVLSTDLSATETVMLDPEKGAYFGVQDVAKTIWSSIGEPTAVRDVCALVADRYEVGDADVEADTLTFLTQLVDAGLAMPVE